MGYEIVNEYGKMTLSEEVIATLAGLAATQCDGIVGMASRKLKDGLAEMLGIENLSKGVEVIVSGQGSLAVNLYIIVAYGARISDVAGEVAHRVREEIQRATALQVSTVRVNVQGVRGGE